MSQDKQSVSQPRIFAPGDRIDEDREARLLADLKNIDLPYVPNVWLAEYVGLRLIDAFKCLDGMPRVAGPKQYGSIWPTYAMILSESDKAAQERQRLVDSARPRVSRDKPTSREIELMIQAIEWPMKFLQGLTSSETRCVVLWAYWRSRDWNTKRCVRDAGLGTYRWFQRSRDRGLSLIAQGLAREGALVT